MFVCICVCLCLSFSVKPNLQVFRAKFSEITPNSIRTACETLIEPDSNISDAVDVRQELDLRIGEVAPSHCGRQFKETYCINTQILSPVLIICRCILHSLPNPSPAEDLSRVSCQSADLIRQLSVSHSWLCGGALQSHTGFHT